MYTITLKINTSEDIQGIKEAIAMDMEKYGDVEVVEVKEDLLKYAIYRYQNFLKAYKFCFVQKDVEYQSGTDILIFHIGPLCFSWFTDCGDWFIYLRKAKIINDICTIKETRFSSAGNYWGKTYELKRGKQ